KFLSGTNLKVTSFPPVEIKDINLMRLKIRLVWQDSKKQQEHEDYYYYEIGELKGNIFINPLNGTLDFHKESVFNTKNYELIAPKDFLFYRNDFIKNNYTN
ncbi:MAG: hypothetical protein U9N49_12085, partial [Campylobacterota bacterium]|nr:hypothetical protein [Campylobacterota bacterium]